MRPRVSTVMRSERFATTLRLCSTMSTVRSAATALISALMRSISSCPIPAVGRAQELGQQIKAGGLAGAVRPDQRMNGAADDAQIDPVDRHEAGKFLPEIVGFEDDIGTHTQTQMPAGLIDPEQPRA